MAKSTRKSKEKKTSTKKVEAKTKSTKENKKQATKKVSAKTLLITKTNQKEKTPKEISKVKTTMTKRKPAYSKKELEHFKNLILEKKREIIEQLESLRERMIDENSGGFVNENSPYSLHMAEQGTDAFEKEKNYLWAQRETKFLSYLDAALKRIEEGNYGYCIDCGNVIEKGRLEAVPHTQHCVKCKVKFGK